MQNPQRDVPRTVAGIGILGVLLYAIPIFGLLAVLPVKQITGIGGFLDAINATFSVYGPAQAALVKIMLAGFIIALLTSGAVWMIGSDCIQAVAGYDGAFAGCFGIFNRSAILARSFHPNPEAFNAVVGRLAAVRCGYGRAVETDMRQR